MITQAGRNRYTKKVFLLSIFISQIPSEGHPCWELLDPNPSIFKLFDEFNQLFFAGVLDYRVDVEWSVPADGEVSKTDARNGKRLIILNPERFLHRSRRELIEILIVCVIVVV